MLDRHGRLHDALGRFARSGRLRVSASEYGDRPGNRQPQIRRAPNAFQPPTPASARRARHNRIVDVAHQVHAAYAAVERGTASWKQRESISYQSPRKMAESRARTGDVIKPIREALRGKVGFERGYTPTRTGFKRTFTGKPIVVRGTGPEYVGADGYIFFGKRFRGGKRTARQKMGGA